MTAMGFVSTSPDAEHAAPPPTVPTEGRRWLNIGCGARFHQAWVNLDTSPADPRVLRHDVTKGLPFPDHSFDFVYHSHLLEHLTPEQGRRLLRECHRVLVPAGTIRVAVPDLEQITRLYLEALDKARGGDVQWQHNYDWMLIELFDQTVREKTGGMHGHYLNRDDIPNVDFVIERHGREAEMSIEGQRLMRAASSHGGNGQVGRESSAVSPLRRMLRAGRRTVKRLRHPRRALLDYLLGDERELLELGRFRRSGEIHQWMYDAYSLSNALVESGFESPCPMPAGCSALAGWRGMGLDVDAEGGVFKPDSLFMEATRPHVSRAGDGRTGK